MKKMKLYLLARGTIVQINAKTGKGVPFTDEEKQLLLGK